MITDDEYNASAPLGMNSGRLKFKQMISSFFFKIKKISSEIRIQITFLFIALARMFSPGVAAIPKKGYSNEEIRAFLWRIESDAYDAMMIPASESFVGYLRKTECKRAWAELIPEIKEKINVEWFSDCNQMEEFIKEEYPFAEQLLQHRREQTSGVHFTQAVESAKIIYRLGGSLD